jgi:hypothetical protein
MDLTGMTRKEVADLQRMLAVVASASDVLAEGGLSPVIDLTDDGVMLTAAWESAPAAAPVLIEPAAGPVIGPWDLSVEEASPAVAPDGAQVVALKAAEDTGAADRPLPEPAGGQDAEAPPPEEDAARGAFSGGGQDLPAIQPGMTGLSARGEGSTAQSPEPAPAVGESGGAAAEDSDLSGSSPPAEPPAAATGTAAAVTAPPLPGPHPPAGERVGAPALITGALSDAEKAEIRRRHAAGETSREIAAALNRRVQPVGAWISGLAHQEKIAFLKAQAAEPAAPPAPASPAPEVAPRPGVPDHIAGEHRRIWTFLDGLPPEPLFDAATDLAVYDAYDSGRGVQALALDLGVDGAALVRRYKDIVGCILDHKGRPRPELKMKLSAVLRWRAEAAAKTAAKTAAA